MNTNLIKKYITLYKDNFSEVSEMEIYKWRAVKHFHDHWDLEAPDFVQMLSESLSKTDNLLGSGRFFPRRMIRNFSKAEPEEVRDLFKLLYNLEIDMETRVHEFRARCENLKNKLYTPKDNHFQDARAIMVYLCLRYPQDYYLYKYRMFRDFSNLINYPYKPKMGDFESVLRFQALCDAVKGELLQDNVLLNLHHKRLDDAENYYQDPTYTLLTQDFIYACVNHLEAVEAEPEQEIKVSVEHANIDDFVVKQTEANLKGRFTDYEKQQKRNSAIGISGEEFVLEYERKKLEDEGVKNINKKLKHISMTKGDGLGYDIQSVDEKGATLYIEVKTTSGDLHSPFYLTRNELACSQKHPEKYRLYRLYDFNATKRTGKIKVFSGDLSKLCVQPVNYQVMLTDKKNKDKL